MTTWKDPDDVVEVRPARREDLVAMDASVPAPGDWNAIRLERHLAGETVLMLAFDGGECIGRAEVLLSGSSAPEVQAIHPGVPEVNGVEVTAARRGQGVGRRLVAEAARAALERGHDRVGIGVEPDNEGARRLYTRLGFSGALPYIDRYAITNDDGHCHDAADACVFLTARSESVAGG